MLLPISIVSRWLLLLFFLLLVHLPNKAFVLGFVHRTHFSKLGVMQAATTTTDAESSTPEKHALIVGAGIMGLSTAYYLQHNHGISSTLIDTTGRIAPAASGKAGGFLALDWNDGTATAALTRRSFALHQELSDTFGADTIQYRRLDCATVAGNNNHGESSSEWVPNAALVRPMGTTDTIAQVHPLRLCEQLFAASKAKIVRGRVVGVVRSSTEDGCCIEGVRVEDDATSTSVVPGTIVVYCCGPWNPPCASKELMQGIKYHSVILPTRRVLSQCVFFAGNGDPEVYVRPDSTAYCTGFPESARVVTEVPGEESVETDRVDTIVQAVQSASGGTDGAIDWSQPRVKDQACYLPTTLDGIPIIGQVESNVYMATGHSCWGILMGPATGESLASLIATGASEKVELAPFSPSRHAGVLQ